MLRDAKIRAATEANMPWDVEIRAAVEASMLRDGGIRAAVEARMPMDEGIRAATEASMPWDASVLPMLTVLFAPDTRIATVLAYPNVSDAIINRCLSFA